MPINKIDIHQLIKVNFNIPVFDVRSPSEYNQAHIPFAISLPLFTNEERKIIGTAYKQKSREEAIKIGLQSFGKNLVTLVEEVEKQTVDKNSKEVVVHCWRGGMRSAAVAWLLDLYGFKVNVLVGGYKSYRKWVLEQFSKPYSLIILGGYTGSNKTSILKFLKNAGEMTIDLEGLACHKGSAFGNLESNAQPTQEHFENELALQLFKNIKLGKKIWVEGESQRIGNVNIPPLFYKTMRIAPMLFLEIPFESRLDNIVEGYGKNDYDAIISATMRIKKRLGGLETKNAINFLLENDIKNCFSILLNYYDKSYLKSTTNNEFKERKIVYVKTTTVDAKINLEKIIPYAKL